VLQLLLDCRLLKTKDFLYNVVWNGRAGSPFLCRKEVIEFARMTGS